MMVEFILWKSKCSMGVASLRRRPSCLRCRATSLGWRPTCRRWRAASTEAGWRAGAGPMVTRWRCAPASSQRAGVMTSWTPTTLSMPLGRRWPWAWSVGGVVRAERMTATIPRPSISALRMGRITRSDTWPGALPCSFWPSRSPAGLGCRSTSWPMSVRRGGPSDGWGGATPSRPFTCCRNVSCIVARMDCMSSNGSGLDLANDEAAGRPSFSPGSEAEQSLALLEVQWKVMKRLDGGGKREALGRWKGPPGTGVKSIGNKLQWNQNV